MTSARMFELAVILYASAWALYLLLLPVAARFAGSRRNVRAKNGRRPKIMVLVPAGNVGPVIAACIQAIFASGYPRKLLDIYVIADHCTDGTVEYARGAGAAVLARDEGARGKTYAIAWALDQLKAQRVVRDLYVIVDATAIVQEGFLAAMAESWSRGEDIVSNYTIVTPDNRTWYARCLALMFVHRNLQNQARQRLGLSALLGGCGMAFSRRYIDRFGWSLALPKVQGAHPTEDWRHAVRAVEEGYRVGFAENARVATPLRDSLAGATQQGARWERGRLINASTYAVRLLLQAFWQRAPLKIFAALDAMQPPVAILSALSFAIAASTIVFNGAFDAHALPAYVPLGAILLYGSLVVSAGCREGIAPSTVIWGPLYLGWRCVSFVLAWAFVDRVRIAGVAAERPSATAAEPLGRVIPVV